MISERFFRVCAGVLLGIFLLLSIGSALRESLTYDEVVHIEEGRSAIEKHEFLVDTNNPPLVRELAVIPLLLGADKNTHSRLPSIRALPARLVVIGMGLALGLAILFVANVYFGREAGLFALFLYVFEPNILAHSHYVTLDTGTTLFFFLGYMSLVWLMKERSWRAFVVHGVCVGIMAASKITTLPYYAVSALILVPLTLRGELFTWFQKRPMRITVSVLIFLLTIWSTYFFKTNVIIAPGDAQGRVSAVLEAMALAQNNQILFNTLQFLRSTPVPLGDYIAIMKNTIIRSTRPAEYFYLGEFVSDNKWYFMMTNVLLKTPVILMVLFILALYIGLKRKKKSQDIWIFAIPVFSILLVASLSKMQSQVRYVLPMYPFLVLTAAFVYTSIKQSYQKILLFIACVLYIIGTLFYYPHFISYTNELLWPKETAYEKFIDSNIDWGQSLGDMQAYVEKTKPRRVQFSYFGRDDAAAYGFVSDFPFGSYKFNEICAFHETQFPNNSGPSIRAISISNWFYCGYNLDSRYTKMQIREVVGRSILVFSE